MFYAFATRLWRISARASTSRLGRKMYHFRLEILIVALVGTAVLSVTHGFLHRVSDTTPLMPRYQWYLFLTAFWATVLFLIFLHHRRQTEHFQRELVRKSRKTLDTIPQMVWAMAADGHRPDFYNDRWYEFTGLSWGSTSGPAWVGLFHPDDVQESLLRWREARDTCGNYEAQYRLRDRNGDYRWVVSRGRAERDAAGFPVRWYGTCTDVHERILQQQALRQSEARVRRILDSVPQIIWSARADGQIDYITAQWAGLREGDRARLLGLGWRRGIHPDDLPRAEKNWSECVSTGKGFEAELRVRQPSGEYRWTLVRAIPESDEQSSVLRWYGTCTDVHDRVTAQHALEQSEQLNRGIIEASPDCVSLLDREGKVLFVNEATVRAYGVRDKSTLIGQNWGSRFSPALQIEAHAARQEAQRGEIGRFVLQGGGVGRDRWFDVVVAPIPGEDKASVKLVVISRDITDQKRAEERAQWAANHDALTGVPNRFLMQNCIDQRISGARSSGEQFALLVLDIDYLKRINDGLGHDAGDALLREVAKRLKSSLRQGDTVARFGGDEFAVLLGDVGSPADLDSAGRDILTALAEPFSYGGRMIDCHASMGACIYPTHGKIRKELLKNADIALYAAKSSARGQMKIFHPSMRHEMQKRTSMLNLAKDALEKRLVVPYYQPKCDLRSGEVSGFEALLRWRHPQKGIQAPATIAAAFEDLHLAAQISDQMIGAVIADMVRWRDQGVDFGHVAINASAADFRRDGFAEHILERLAKARILPSRLQLEVTETVFLGRGAECVGQALTTLSSAGVKIALDDFGTGYASLSHLKQFPVDIIKIDQSFVRELGQGPDATAIVVAVIKLGQSLGIEIVAEGIEALAQHDFLSKAGCEYGQGYFYGRAAPAERVPAISAYHLSLGQGVHTGMQSAA